MSEWIPVSERLPEPDSGLVLVWSSAYGWADLDEWATHHEDPTGMSTVNTVNMGVMWREHEFEDISHWCPLPPRPLPEPPHREPQT